MPADSGPGVSSLVPALTSHTALSEAQSWCATLAITRVSKIAVLADCDSASLFRYWMLTILDVRAFQIGVTCQVKVRLRLRSGNGLM